MTGFGGNQVKRLFEKPKDATEDGSTYSINSKNEKYTEISC